MIIWLHIDDIIFFSNSLHHLFILQQNMENSLCVKWFDNPEKIVGLKLEQSQGKIELSQHLLIDQLISRHKLEFNQCHFNTYTPLANIALKTSDCPPVDPTSYQSYIGSLNYIVLGTCPDLSFSVNFLARFSSNPDLSHWQALHHLIRYLKTTRTKKLLICSNVSYRHGPTQAGVESSIVPPLVFALNCLDWPLLGGLAARNPSQNQHIVPSSWL